MLTVAVALAVGVGALAQSVSGIGFSLVAGPLLLTALGPREGVRLGIALSVLVNVVLLARSRRELDRRGAVLLLVPGALVTPLVAAGARSVPAAPLQLAAGTVIVVGAVLLATGARWARATGPAGAVAVSLAAAVTNVVAGVGGPPLALWTANAGWSPARTLATLQACFLGLNLAALASLGFPASGGRVVLAAALALGGGLLAGGLLATRVPPAVARRTTLALAALGGAAVVVRSLA